MGVYDTAVYDMDVYDSGAEPASVEIDGVVYRSLLEAKVDLYLGGISNAFSITLPNPGGRYNTTFNQNQDVLVTLPDLGAGSNHVVIRGFIDGNNQRTTDKRALIELSGVNYWGKLQSRIVNDIYTSREVSDVLTDATDGLMRYFSDWIDLSGVQVTTTTLASVNFIGKYAADVVKQLADQVNYWAYIEDDLVFHFEPKSFVPSAFVFSSSLKNVLKTPDLQFDGKKIYTVVHVYGGYVETASYSDPKVGDGSTLSFTLGEKPKYQTFTVTVDGTPAVEGTDFTVNYDNPAITFVTAPGAGDAIAIEYTARRQVVWTSSNAAAVAAFGTRELSITDDAIKTMARAQEVADINLALSSDERTVIKIKTYGAPRVRPGMTIRIDYPESSIVQTDYDVMEVHHSYARGGFTSELVLASNSIATLPELLKQIQADLNEVRLREYTQNPTGVASQIDAETGSGAAVQTIETAPMVGFILDIALVDVTVTDGATVYDTVVESGTGA